MKTFNKFSLIILVAVFGFGFFGSNIALAATTPSLGSASTFGILSSTFTRNTAVTAITGDLGYTTLSGSGSHTIVGNTYIGGGVGDSTYQQAGIDQGAALTALNNQPCTYTFPDTAIDLATDTTHGSMGVYTPGVYCTRATRAAEIGTAGITLDGAGTYIFRINGAFTSVADSRVTLTNGASSCDVFWTPTAATTLGANSTFVGTDIDAAGITVGANVAWTGRALAFGGTVVTNTDTINATCTVAAVSGYNNYYNSNNTITFFKQVINDNGGTALFSDFPLFVNGSPVTSGQSIRLDPGVYKVTETSSSNYKTTFAGDCDATGKIVHGGVNTHNDVCTIINDDIGPVVASIPPLINVTKIPSPLSLTSGSGFVTYNYLVSNVGIVPMTNVTVVDDKCTSVSYISGDANHDSKLDINEVWKYACSAMLTQTTKNTVTASGSANGLVSVDVADATVVVGSMLPPPLINVIKIPTPFFLPSTGGIVKYTYLVNNPGTVSLNGVKLVDDKCIQISNPSGDMNSNGMLDTNETWTYSCQMNLSTTTTNTSRVEGTANGLTAVDFSLATVVVNPPKLSNAGIPPIEKSITWYIILGVFLTVFASVIVIKKRTI